MITQKEVKMRTFFSVSLILLFPFLSFSGKIVFNDNIPYFIYVQENAIPAEKTAALELQKYLRKISGTTLPIVSRPPAEGKKIFIGISPEVEKMLPEIDFRALKMDEILIATTADGHLILCGEGTRGTLYAVYTLLEKEFGVRFWSSDCESIPQKEKLEVSELFMRYAPPFFMRGTLFCDFMKNPVFAAKMRLNGYFEPIPEEYGGNISFAQGKKHQGLVHTFHQLIPSDVYYDSHPEFFSEVNGKRLRVGGQLCLSNVEMRRELVKNASEWLRNLKKPVKLISISQNDYLKGYCECAACSSAARTESQTDILLRFVNQVADELGKEFPGLIVETLAYYYTLSPPQNVRPGKNVMIRFAPILSDYSMPLDGTGKNNPNLIFARNLKKWNAWTDRLAVWNYLLNTSNYFLPRPDLDTIGCDLRFFAEHGVIAVFEQGHLADSMLTNFGPLRYWLAAKLMWNPYQDEKALMREFLEGYYGSSADAMAQVIRIMNDEFRKNGKHLPISLGGCAWFRIPQIRKAIAILEKAMRENREPKQRARLKLAKTHFEFALLDTLDPDQMSAAEKHEALRLLDYLKQIARQTNTKYYGEGKLFPQYAEELREKFVGVSIKDEKTSRIPPFCKQLEKDQYYEFGPTKFRLYQKGVSTFIAEDPGSASTKIAKLNAENNWLLQFQLPAGTWTAMIALRPDGKAAGKIGTVGFYDETTGVTKKNKVLSAKNFPPGKFSWISLGPFIVKKGYLYVAPEKSALNAIDVERIILLKQEK